MRLASPRLKIAASPHIHHVSSPNLFSFYEAGSAPHDLGMREWIWKVTVKVDGPSGSLAVAEILRLSSLGSPKDVVGPFL